MIDENQSILCINCSSLLQTYTYFCPVCGYDQRSGPPPVPPPQAAPGNPQQFPSGQAGMPFPISSALKRYRIIVAALSACLAIAVGLALYFRFGTSCSDYADTLEQGDMSGLQVINEDGSPNPTPGEPDSAGGVHAPGEAAPEPPPSLTPPPGTTSPPSGQNEESELTEEHAFAAFREFLDAPQPIIWGTRSISWGVQDVRYTELVDFDNDGIPEMVLVVTDSDFSPESFDQRHWILVVGLVSLGRADVLYSHSIGYSGPAEFWHEIAISSDGRVLLVSNLESNFSASSEFQVLDGGVFSSVLSIGISFGIEDEETVFSIDNVVVSRDEFDRELSEWLGGIVNVQELMLDTENDVQAFLTGLG